MPDPAYTYFYEAEFFAVILALWAMMFILDWIWPSNYEREWKEQVSGPKQSQHLSPYRPIFSEDKPLGVFAVMSVVYVVIFAFAWALSHH